jgi:hypothetical protein
VQFEKSVAKWRAEMRAVGCAMSGGLSGVPVSVSSQTLSGFLATGEYSNWQRIDAIQAQ